MKMRYELGLMILFLAVLIWVDGQVVEPEVLQSFERASLPPELVLPFHVDDIREGDAFISPFGVVRWSKDRSEFGHSGIDIPLEPEAAIYAAFAGEIVSVTAATDGRPGSNVTLRSDGKAPPGEGWGFLYEHIFLDPGIEAGSVVTAGQRIGQAALQQHSNNHLQLTYLFNDYQYYQDHRCWVEYLVKDDARALERFFMELSETESFRESWRVASEEGNYQYRGLLDEGLYPDGLQLCYSPGTDVREWAF